MHSMPGDVAKQTKIEMLEGKHSDKKRSKSYRNLIHMRERATLKREEEREIAENL